MNRTFLNPIHVSSTDFCIVRISPTTIDHSLCYCYIQDTSPTAFWAMSTMSLWLWMAMDGYGYDCQHDRQQSHGHLRRWHTKMGNPRPCPKNWQGCICECKRLQKGTLQRPHFCITLNQSNEISSNNTTKKTDKGMRQKCQNQLYL